MLVAVAIRAAFAFNAPVRKFAAVQLPKVSFRQAAAIIGWMAVAIVVAATLSPIGARPHLAGLGVHVERFGAYFLAGLALSAAYPKQITTILIGLVLLAVGLEIGQSFESTRHARAFDAIVKVAGGMAGVMIAMAGRRLLIAPR